MPAFLVTYTTTRTGHDIKHETEWIAPSNYDSDRARQAFERQFPTAAVLCFEEID